MIPTDSGASTCALSDSWSVAGGIAILAPSPIVLANPGLEGGAAIAVGVDASDTDQYVVLCKSGDVTSSVPVNWCGKLGYSWTAIWTPPPPAGNTGQFRGEGNAASDVFFVPGNLPPSSTYGLTLRCLIVDISSSSCGAADPSRQIQHHFTIVTDACGRVTPTFLNSTVDLPLASPPITPTQSECCNAGATAFAGPPITFSGGGLLDPWGRSSNVVVVGEALRIHTKWTDLDLLRRSCDDNNGANCPPPIGALIRRLECDDVPLVEYTVTRTTLQGGAGTMIPANGPPTADWVAPSDPGRFLLCPVARNRNCAAADGDSSPGGLALRAVPLTVKERRPRADAWNVYPATGAALAAAALDCACIPVLVNDNDSDQDGVNDLDDPIVSSAAASSDPDLAGLSLMTDPDLEVMFLLEPSSVLSLWCDAAKSSPLQIGKWLPVSSLVGAPTQGAQVFVEAHATSPHQVVSIAVRTDPQNTAGDINFLRVMHVHYVAKGIASVAFDTPAEPFPPVAPTPTGVALGRPWPWASIDQSWRPDGLVDLSAVGSSDLHFVEPDPVLGVDDPTTASTPTENGHLTWIENLRNVLAVRARVSPPKAGEVVWFRSYDVDDNTHDPAVAWLDDDSIPAGGLVPVADNVGFYENYDEPGTVLGTMYSPFPERPEGILMANPNPLNGIPAGPNPVLLSAVTDANGEAVVYLCVSTTAGDNYRVVASLDRDTLTADALVAPGPSNWTSTDAADAVRKAAKAAVAYKMTPTTLDPVEPPVMTAPAAQGGSMAVTSACMTVRRVMYVAVDQLTSVAPYNRLSTFRDEDQNGFGMPRQLAEFYPVQTASGQTLVKLVFDVKSELNGRVDNTLQQYWEEGGIADRDPSSAYADALAATPPQGTTVQAPFQQFNGRGAWSDGKVHLVTVDGLNAAAFHLVGSGRTTAMAEAGAGATTTLPFSIATLGVVGSMTSLRRDAAGQLVVGGATPSPQASWVQSTLAIGTRSYTVSAVDAAAQSVTLSATAADLPVYVVDDGWRFLEAMGVPLAGGPLPQWSITKPVRITAGSTISQGTFLDRLFRNVPMAVRPTPAGPPPARPMTMHSAMTESWDAWAFNRSWFSVANILSRPRSWTAVFQVGYDSDMPHDNDPVGEGPTINVAVGMLESTDWPPDSTFVIGYSSLVKRWETMTAAGRASFLQPWTPYGYSPAEGSIAEYEIFILRNLGALLAGALAPNEDDPLPTPPVGGYTLDWVATLPGIAAAENLTDPGLVSNAPVQRNAELQPTIVENGTPIALQECGVSPYIVWFVRHHLNHPGVWR
ncbi:MAG: hypothetical protein AB7O97_06925 [Planctomycetota bacterium]